VPVRPRPIRRRRPVHCSAMYTEPAVTLPQTVASHARKGRPLLPHQQNEPKARPDSASVAVQVSSPSSCTPAIRATVPAVLHRTLDPSSDLASAALSLASADTSASSVPPPRTVPPNTYSNIGAGSTFWRNAISSFAAASPANVHHARIALDVVNNGVSIVPHSLPEPIELSNSSTVRSHPEPVRTRIAHYLAMGAIERCARSDIRATHPLHVVIKADKPKPRVVLNLRPNLNDSLPLPRMRVAASVDTAVKLSKPGCWYGKIDVSDCFLAFPVTSAASTLLGFAFDGSYYRFRRLPFGLSTAPYWCETMMTIVSWVLEQRGVRHARYCDDFFIVGDTRAECAAMMATCLATLTEFGFAMSPDKTLGPSQQLEFLGIMLDSVSCTTSCSPARLSELHTLLATAAHSPARRSVRSVLSLVGKLSFASAVLHGARPFFRSLLDICRGRPIHHHLSLNAECRSDMRYWLRFLSTWNGRCAWVTGKPTVIATDASMSGFGAHILHSPAAASLPPHLPVGAALSGAWCVSDRPLVTDHRDIQYAELFAVVAAAAAVAPFLAGTSIVFLVDNAAGVAIINRQSTRSSALLTLLRALYATSTEHNIHIRARHIAGVHNTVADRMSRLLAPVVTHVSPSPLPVLAAGSVACCSCDLIVSRPSDRLDKQRNVRWSMASFLPSLAWRFGSIPTRPMHPSCVTIRSSAWPPVVTPELAYPKSVWQQLSSGLFERGPSTALVRTFPHFNGFTPAGVTVRSRVDPSTLASNAVSNSCSLPLMLSNASSHSHSITSTRSTTGSTSTRLPMHATGQQQRSVGSVFSGFVSSAMPDCVSATFR